MTREFDPSRSELSSDIREQVEISIKYEGYINRQNQQIKQVSQMESRLLPENTDYNDISGLRLEARQKLNAVRPLSLGQASRISGVSPADIGVLIIWLKTNETKNGAPAEKAAQRGDCNE
jgi:tRNA uridine 5-carboxymethylaminomethyl modification enzyme